jgi:hypothetical protein
MKGVIVNSHTHGEYLVDCEESGLRDYQMV